MKFDSRKLYQQLMRKNPALYFFSQVFRLKKNHQNLDNSHYASNLCQYLDQAKGITGLSMGDLQNLLNGLQSISIKVPVAVPSNVMLRLLKIPVKRKLMQLICFKYGEHIACM